jgi:hypothetical protein
MGQNKDSTFGNIIYQIGEARSRSFNLHLMTQTSSLSKDKDFTNTERSWHISSGLLLGA